MFVCENVNTLRKKRNHLSLSDKNKIINDLDRKTTTIDAVASKYNTGKSSIYRILSNKDKIKSSVQLVNQKKRKTLRAGVNVELENSLYSWILDER